MARTLQEDAERPKGEAGQAMKLMGTEREAIVSKGREFLDPDRYQAMARVKDIEQGNWIFCLIGLGKTILDISNLLIILG
jgi:hypothetical protein